MQHPEPGAGGQPGAQRPCRLLCTQGARLSGGGARWKPATQAGQKRLLRNLNKARREEVLQSPKCLFREESTHACT